MFSIGTLFSKIKNRHAQELARRTCIAEALSTHTGITIPLDQITYKHGVVTIKGLSPAGRSTLFTKRMSVIEKINSINKELIVTDIRTI